METLRYWRRLWDADAWWFLRWKRDEPPFKLYVAQRGKGKSLKLTHEAIKLIRKTKNRTKVWQHSVTKKWMQPDGLPDTITISNYPLHDLKTLRSAVMFLDIEHLMSMVAEAVQNDQTVIIVIDEAANIFDARDWEKTPAWFKQFLAESRHYKCGVLAATQALSQVEKRFRILCDEIIRIRPVFEGHHHRYAFFALTRLEQDFDSAEEEAREVGASWFTYVPAPAYAGYSTSALPSDEAVSKTNEAAIAALLARSRQLVTEGAVVASRLHDRDDSDTLTSSDCDF